MKNIKDISIIFPIYNEEKRISFTIKYIKKFLKKKKFKKIEIILVNDGSTDNTNLIIKKIIDFNLYKNIKYIILTKNTGKGYALKKGVMIAKNNWILTSDADLSVKLNDIKNFDKCITKNKKIIYFGSRNLSSSIVVFNIFRKIIGFFFLKIIQFFLKIQIKDTQCGFKLYNKRIAKDIFKIMKSKRFIHDVEIALICRKLKINILEVPVKWTHKAHGSLNIFTDTLLMLIGIFRLKNQYKNMLLN
jgi:dolichyl-phosphate beta-glucosyltransferase